MALKQATAEGGFLLGPDLRNAVVPYLPARSSGRVRLVTRESASLPILHADIKAFFAVYSNTVNDSTKQAQFISKLAQAVEKSVSLLDPSSGSSRLAPTAKSPLVWLHVFWMAYKEQLDDALTKDGVIMVKLRRPALHTDILTGSDFIVLSRGEHLLMLVEDSEYHRASREWSDPRWEQFCECLTEFTEGERHLLVEWRKTVRLEHEHGLLRSQLSEADFFRYIYDIDTARFCKMHSSLGRDSKDGFDRVFSWLAAANSSGDVKGDETYLHFSTGLEPLMIAYRSSSPYILAVCCVGPVWPDFLAEPFDKHGSIFEQVIQPFVNRKLMNKRWPADSLHHILLPPYSDIRPPYSAIPESLESLGGPKLIAPSNDNIGNPVPLHEMDAGVRLDHPAPRPRFCHMNFFVQIDHVRSYGKGQERYCDTFLDTEDLRLFQRGYFLRQRTIPTNAGVDTVWSLKQTSLHEQIICWPNPITASSSKEMLLRLRSVLEISSIFEGDSIVGACPRVLCCYTGVRCSGEGSPDKALWFDVACLQEDKYYACGVISMQLEVPRASTLNLPSAAPNMTPIPSKFTAALCIQNPKAFALMAPKLSESAMLSHPGQYQFVSRPDFLADSFESMLEKQ